jgi:DNA polymerase III epsilon subunit-like protein
LKSVNTSFKLLYLDIETSPANVLVWGLFNQNISIDQVLKPTSVLCWAAKWHGKKEVMYASSKEQEGPVFNEMIRGIHKLLCEADAVCHYNGKSFDIPRLNQEFLRLKLAPPPTIPQIDLKQVVMSKFSMTSSKLAFVGPYLDIGDKVKHSGWDLWIKCLAGDAAAWKTMRTYNCQDVVLLEKLYNRVLPWIDAHPNQNLYSDSEEHVCPNCASEKLQRRGYRMASTRQYIRYQCMSCGRWSKSRTAERFPIAARV